MRPAEDLPTTPTAEDSPVIEAEVIEPGAIEEQGVAIVAAENRGVLARAGITPERAKGVALAAAGGALAGAVSYAIGKSSTAGKSSALSRTSAKRGNALAKPGAAKGRMLGTQ